MAKRQGAQWDSFDKGEMDISNYFAFLNFWAGLHCSFRHLPTTVFLAPAHDHRPRPHPCCTAPAACLQRMLSLHDFEAEARRRLPRPIFGYIAGAAEDNRSLQDNRS